MKDNLKNDGPSLKFSNVPNDFFNPDFLFPLIIYLGNWNDELFSILKTLLWESRPFKC